MEVYEREIGLDLERRNLDRVIVKESPRKRDVSALLRKYKSRFLVDLHDPGRPRNSIDEPDKIADLSYTRSKLHHSYFRKFADENYLRGYKQIPGYKNKQFPRYSIGLYETTYANFNPRHIGVELLPWTAKEKSLDFLERLTNHLKTYPLQSKF